MLITSNYSPATYSKQRSISPMLIRNNQITPNHPIPIRTYQKYPFLKQSILIQLIKKADQPLPSEVNLDRKPLADFCDFVSQEIYRYILANNNQYTGDSKQQFKVDVQEYKLTRDQLSDLDFRKSVVIMLNEYLQFTVAIINEMANLIKQMEEGKSEKNYYPLKVKLGNTKLSFESPKNNVFNKSNKSNNLPDTNLAHLEKHLIEKEKQKIDDYLNNKKISKTLYHENSFLYKVQCLILDVIIKEDDLHHSAKGNALKFLNEMYELAVDKMEIINDNKMNEFYQSDEELIEALTKSDKFQLDEWI